MKTLGFRTIFVCVFLLGLVPSVHAEDSKDVTGKAPALQGRDLEGKRFKLSKALEDGPALITFWATWCRPCRKEMPELQKLRKKYEEHGVQVIAISGDSPVDQAKVKPYIKAQKFDFTVLLDTDGEIRRRFQVEVFPTTFLVGADNRILYRGVGYRRGDEKVLESYLRTALELKPETAKTAKGDE